MALGGSFIKNIDLVQTYASRTSYPYQLILAEHDHLVNNKSSREWHEKTKSETKQINMMAGSYHELSKEPNNAKFFEYMLKFVATRLSTKPKAFGKINGKKDVTYGSKTPFFSKKNFWLILIIAYLLIGALLAITRRQKRLFFSWPAFLVIAKRLK